MSRTTHVRASPPRPEPLETLVRPSLPVDLDLTLWPLRRGAGDPTMRREPGGAWWRATRTRDGPATVRFEPQNGHVRVQAWGPGAERALAGAPDLLGARDDLDGFHPPPGLVRELHRRLSGLRITRSGAVLEALVPTVLEQKVTGKESRTSYRQLVRALREPAPGPLDLVLPPGPATLAGTPYHRFHPFGIEMRRAAAIRFAAARAARLEEAASMPPAEARRRLRAFPGVGEWTAAEVAILALGDADAVSVGDYHLPHIVAFALAGEHRGDDARMLELLEPYAGHRGRVLRLLVAAGIGPPRLGPRRALRDIRRL